MKYKFVNATALGEDVLDEFCKVCLYIWNTYLSLSGISRICK